MPFSFGRRFINRRQPGQAAAVPLRFTLTRIIGNDLPPRQAPGQALANLRFIIENEGDLPGCGKRWILNRIADASVEKAVMAALEAHGQSYSRIAFQLAEFARLARPAGSLPITDDPGPEARRALLQAERPRIAYAFPINAARNQALLEARSATDWILPFDGNCFMPAEGWAAISAYVGERAGLRYATVAMTRVSGEGGSPARNSRARAEGEPQVMFHRDAPLAFDEAQPYGRRDKVELLWRLGVAGPWDKWRDDAYDTPRPRPAVAGREVGHTGFVIRLPSGHPELDTGRTADRDRGRARDQAILDFLAALDRRVGAELLAAR